jgi:hypothetical protein
MDCLCVVHYTNNIDYVYFRGACEIKLWFICGLKKILLNLHLEL